MTTAPQNLPNREDPLLVYGQNPPRRIPWKRLLPFVIVILAITAMIPFAGRAMEPTVGRHVSRRLAPIAGVPPSASDVCYSLRGAFGAGEAYEFTIDESAFLAWAKGPGWKVEPITSSVTVERYGDY